MDKIRDTMRRFCIAINQVHRAYYTVSEKGSEMWLLYMLDDGGAHSQKQICEEFGFARTTLNAVIKQAETAGYITLVPITGKRREMNVCLTERGAAYAREILEPIYRAEDEAMEKVLHHDCENFVDAIEYFGECLKEIFGRKQDNEA